MTMIYTIIGKDEKQEVLLVIVAFSECQVPVAITHMRKAHPNSAITVDSHIDEPHLLDDDKRY